MFFSPPREPGSALSGASEIPLLRPRYSRSAFPIRFVSRRGRICRIIKPSKAAQGIHPSFGTQPRRPFRTLHRRHIFSGRRRQKARESILKTTMYPTGIPVGHIFTREQKRRCRQHRLRQRLFYYSGNSVPPKACAFAGRLLAVLQKGFDIGKAFREKRGRIVVARIGVGRLEQNRHKLRPVLFRRSGKTWGRPRPSSPVFSPVA